MPDIDGIPYVEPGDLVSGYPSVSQSLAQEVSDQLASKPAATYGTTEPSSPATGDIWYDSNDDPATPKYYDGSEFVPFPSGAGDAVISSPAATGNYTDDGVEYDYYTFTASGTLTVDTAGFADVLVVGGGGGGSGPFTNASGRVHQVGGGGGGFVRAFIELEATTHTVTVGGGGDGVAAGAASEGNQSSLGTVLKIGGGGFGRASAGSGRDGHGGGGSPGGVAVTSTSGATLTHDGGGAGGTVFGSTDRDGRTDDLRDPTAPTTYAAGGLGNTTAAGSANTGDGGSRNAAGGSGIVVVRVRTN